MITIVDTTPPAIRCPADDTICNVDFPVQLGATWTDNCSEGGTIYATPTNIRLREDGCAELADYVFNVTDDCGNPATETCTITREFDKYENCETMFGRYAPNNECFITDDRVDFSRWGWTNQISPQDAGAEPYVFNLYAGAAHCDYENKGSEVGAALVSYIDGEIYITYNLTGNYVMNQAHIYVGCDPYPTKGGKKGGYTVAPGQYNYNPGTGLDYVQNFTVGPIDATGDVHVIVHGVVCEATCRCSVSEGPFNYDPETNSGSPEGCEDTARLAVPEPVDFIAYPVPFDESITVKYIYEYDTNVIVEIFDTKGTLVKRILNDRYVKGTEQETLIDISKTANQSLIIRLTTNRGSRSKQAFSSSEKR